MKPQRLEPRFVPRVWGRTDLSPLFGTRDQVIGEVWFPTEEAFPLLVKFIFTSDRLSVQVHPDDDYARKHENSRGKSEMWHILAAEPGARIALGFRESATEAQVRAAVADGSVEHMLEWIPVEAGDTVFTPAGVVHAIGGGITMCEIQQNSDVTYRLYDYGRPRELHLEKGLHVAQLEPYNGRQSMPVACEHFFTEKLDLRDRHEESLGCEHLLITLRGEGTINGEPFSPGEVWRVPAEAGAVTVQPQGTAELIRTRCGSAHA